MAEATPNGHDKKAQWSWTPERKAKFKATMARKRKEKLKAGTKPTKQDDRADDAIVYLRRAVRSINKRIQAGGHETMADLMTKLALKTLQGEE